MMKTSVYLGTTQDSPGRHQWHILHTEMNSIQLVRLYRLAWNSRRVAGSRRSGAEGGRAAQRSQTRALDAAIWVPSPPLPLPSSVTSGTLLNTSLPQFSQVKRDP